MAHAASSIAANYNLVVEEFDGCATPILKGFPVSGKTTVLKAVLSVFGQSNFSSGEFDYNLILLSVIHCSTCRSNFML